jgi:hypothetical protein
MRVFKLEFDDKVLIMKFGQQILLTSLEKNNFLCKQCGLNLKDQVICYGTLCIQCWDKIKPVGNNL